MDPSARKWPTILIGGVFLVVVLAIAAWAAINATADGDGEATQAFRLAGDGRAETAARISQASWPEGAQTVYLLAEDDPLSATAAGLPGGPVFVVASCDPLEDPIAQEITRLDPSRIIAVGGEAAVCDDVISEAMRFAGT